VDLLIALGALIAGIALVVGAADVLVDGLVGVGIRLRIAPFVLTVVLSGFELENLAAGIAANAKGLPGAAAGTVFGGITFLALGVAGIGALIAPMRSDLPRSFLVWTAASPFPVLALGLDGTLSRLDGTLLLVWFVVALLGVARTGRNLLDREPSESVSHPFARLLGGLVVLTAGGALLGDGLRRVVSQLGVSDTLLGNTAVAASVEAEELGRVAVPARRGRPELALGNITGTIVHFAAFNAGAIALVKPLQINHLTRAVHMPVAVGATLVLCLVLGLGSQLSRRDGALLLVLYVGYVAAAIVLS
jgi:cation:H+ antiporter